MSKILSVKQAAKSYGGQQVLKPLSFDVAEGERICILGPSGCGKSTLLGMVAGLIRMDGGEMEMDGILVESKKTYVPPERRPINMVFQDYALWPHMTVKQNIQYGMKRKKTDRSEMERRLERLRRLLRLDGLLGRTPAELSGGQQQRVGIARALATEPKLLLMDEPLSNLDVKLRTDMRGELARLLGELSIAALYVTHDRMEAFTIADRILVLREGAIDQIGRPAELFERPASPWVAQLMGYHNRLSVKGAGGGEAVAMVAGQPIAGQMMTAGKRDGDMVMMLHPDKLAVLGETESSEGNLLAVTVAQSIYEGTAWRILAETADGQIIHAFHDTALRKGASVKLHLPPDSTMLYHAQDGNG